MNDVLVSEASMHACRRFLYSSPVAGTGHFSAATTRASVPHWISPFRSPLAYSPGLSSLDLVGEVVGPGPSHLPSGGVDTFYLRSAATLQSLDADGSPRVESSRELYTERLRPFALGSMSVRRPFGAAASWERFCEEEISPAAIARGASGAWRRA